MYLMGLTMEDNSYIKYTRSLHTNPIFKSMSFQYRHIYLTILVNMAYKPIQLNDHGVLINLKPGQFMTTVRELVKLCDEKSIKKGTVERALIMFEKVGFSGQETGHTKTIITVTEPSICDSLKNKNGTSFGTKTGQERDIKEERKEIKEEKHTHVEIPMEAKRVSGGDCNSYSFSNKEHKEHQSYPKHQEDDEILPSKPLPKTVELKHPFGEEELVMLTYSEHQKLMKIMSQDEFEFWVKQLEIEIARKGLREFNKKNQSHYGAILAFKNYRESRSVGFKTNEVTSPTENIKHAQYTQEYYKSDYYELQIFRDRVEFIPHKGNAPVRAIKFNDNGFKDQFQNELYKKGFKKK